MQVKWYRAASQGKSHETQRHCERVGSSNWTKPLGLPEGQVVEAEVSPVEAVDLEQYGIRPIPFSDYVVTTEMVNEWRDELGI